MIHLLLITNYSLDIGRLYMHNCSHKVQLEIFRYEFHDYIFFQHLVEFFSVTKVIKFLLYSTHLFFCFF
jgi:hypothetical protein